MTDQRRGPNQAATRPKREQEGGIEGEAAQPERVGPNTEKTGIAYLVECLTRVEEAERRLDAIRQFGSGRDHSETKEAIEEGIKRLRGEIHQFSDERVAEAKAMRDLVKRKGTGSEAVTESAEIIDAGPIIRKKALVAIEGWHDKILDDASNQAPDGT